jgi:DNA-binding Lrp family transcriptional regulator
MANDIVGKKILIGLLKDGRSSVRKLSSYYAGISPQPISYKIRSFMGRGIIGSFSVRVFLIYMVITMDLWL